jgi:D-arabinose 1-dehydrogenase-like Zn-dependent alcohol dehydrogenase
LQNFTLFTIGAVAAAVGLGGSCVMAIAYIRAMGALVTYLKQDRPDDWRALLARYYSVNHSIDFMKVMPERAISQVILGLSQMSIPDQQYRQLLWTARSRIICSAILFMAGIVAVGWLFQNSRWPF